MNLSLKAQISNPVEAGRTLEGSAGTSAEKANVESQTKPTILQANLPISIYDTKPKEKPTENKKNDPNLTLNTTQLMAEGLNAGNIIASSHQNQTQAQNTNLLKYNPIMDSIFSAGKQPPAEISQGIVLAFKGNANKKNDELKESPGEYRAPWNGEESFLDAIV